MRRNRNKNLHNVTAKIDKSKSMFIELDKREINKQTRDGFFKSVLASIFRVGRFLKRVIWGSSTSMPTFQKPTREIKIVPSRVIKKRKKFRHMQRD